MRKLHSKWVEKMRKLHSKWVEKMRKLHSRWVGKIRELLLKRAQILLFRCSCSSASSLCLRPRRPLISLWLMFRPEIMINTTESFHNVVVIQYDCKLPSEFLSMPAVSCSIIKVELFIFSCSVMASLFMSLVKLKRSSSSRSTSSLETYSRIEHIRYLHSYWTPGELTVVLSMWWTYSRI